MWLHSALPFRLGGRFRSSGCPAFSGQGFRAGRSGVEGVRRSCWITSSACLLFLAVLQSGVLVSVAVAQSNGQIGFGQYVTFAGNYDVGYRETQLFEEHHDTAVGQWDIRANVWLPPFRNDFSWGVYLDVGGIGASQSEAWENGWLAGPGVGFQIYPFSRSRFRKRDSRVGNLLGPLRFFAESNRLDYWGAENRWRPHRQTRLGADYWRARHVNSTDVPWWIEIWGEFTWQSANEFDAHYDTAVFADSFRAGVRAPNAHFLSTLTPYVAVESTLTGKRQYYWENKLLAGGGIRFAPPLKRSIAELRWMNRFAIFGEYVHVASYYGLQAPASVPNHDLRFGITFDLGDWYR